jgi:hypothetical protein
VFLSNVRSLSVNSDASDWARKMHLNLANTKLVKTRACIEFSKERNCLGSRHYSGFSPMRNKTVVE